jgi:HNH endonuclease
MSAISLRRCNRRPVGHWQLWVPSEIERRSRPSGLATRNSRCEYCRLSSALHPTPFQIDHIIARQHGGGTTLENLAHCNRYKGPNIAGIDPQIVSCSIHAKTFGQNIFSGRRRNCKRERLSDELLSMCSSSMTPKQCCCENTTRRARC